MKRAQERLGRGTLQKGSCLGVNGRAEKIVFRGVANVQMNGSVQRGELHKVGRAKFSGFVRWFSRQRLFAKLFHWPHRGDPVHLTFFGAELLTGERGANERDVYWLGRSVQCESHRRETAMYINSDEIAATSPCVLQRHLVAILLADDQFSGFLKHDYATCLWAGFPNQQFPCACGVGSLLPWSGKRSRLRANGNGESERNRGKKAQG